MCNWDALKENANRKRTKNARILYFCQEQRKNYRDGKKPHAQTVAWSYDVEGHAQKCVERCCELAYKKVEQLHKVSHPCLDVHQFKKEELDSVGGLSAVFSQFCLESLFLARIGRPDILWSVNNLARSVSKWTEACDQRLARLISCVHHTNDYRQYLMWETRHSIADWVWFKTLTLLEILRIQSQPHEVSCVFLEAERLFQSAGCARNERQFLIAPQNLKSFLWMLDYVWMGYRLLTYGTLIEVLRTTKDNIQPGHTSSGKLEQTQPNHTGHKETWAVFDSKTKTQHVTRKQKVDRLTDHVPTNTRSSQGESQLYIFVDNEAVIKMRIKGRSPTVMHVSEPTESLLIDCLIGSTWTPKSKSNVDTKTNLLTF